MKICRTTVLLGSCILVASTLLVACDINNVEAKEPVKQVEKKFTNKGKSELEDELDNLWVEYQDTEGSSEYHKQLLLVMMVIQQQIDNEY